MPDPMPDPSAEPGSDHTVLDRATTLLLAEHLRDSVSMLYKGVLTITTTSKPVILAALTYYCEALRKTAPDQFYGRSMLEDEIPKTRAKTEAVANALDAMVAKRPKRHPRSRHA